MKSKLNFLILLLVVGFCLSECPGLKCFLTNFSHCVVKDPGKFLITTNKGENQLIDQHAFKDNQSNEYYYSKGIMYSEYINAMKANKNLMKIEGLEINQKEKVFCLLTNYVEGTDLSTFLKENVSPAKNLIGWLSETFFEEERKKKKNLFFNIFECMSSSLSIINSSGFIHGDVKPSNFLIDSKGDCVLVNYDNLFSKKTNLITTDPLFSLPYVAPELAEFIVSKAKRKNNSFTLEDYSLDIFKGEYLEKIDSYAIGVFLYDVLFDKFHPLLNINDVYRVCGYGDKSEMYMCWANLIHNSYYNSTHDDKLYNLITNYDKSKFNDVYIIFLKNGNGKYKIDFTMKELSWLFKTVSKLLAVNPEERLSLSEV